MGRTKKPAAPAERPETARRQILAFLDGPPATAREISVAVRLPEKEVVDHLEHLERTVSRQGREFVVVPAECLKCGFVFRKRDRLRKPGKCPLCRQTMVSEPLFAVK